MHRSEESRAPDSSWRIGCAGWSVPSAAGQAFPAEGSHLQRYASVFSAVEINSSFYRPHQPQTYARWRDSVPEDFRFAVKVPKAITHIARLKETEALIDRFAGEAGRLEEKLGCLLVQLPPSLRFEAVSAERFFRYVQGVLPTAVVCEPRHATWFTAEAASLLASLRIPYVRADPPTGAPPGDAVSDLLYVRLHGSPVMYYSNYDAGFLQRLAGQLAEEARRGKAVWCIFDNTADGHAVPNALSLLETANRLGHGRAVPHGA